jgi:DNA-binding transcriptional regulator YdaS (Cro superfamily)
VSNSLSPEKAALRRAADVLGGQAAMAKVLGLEDRRRIWPYFHTDRRFPTEYCPLIEKATRDLNDTVPCEELRPDVAWDVLRIQPPWDGKERRGERRAEK